MTENPAVISSMTGSELENPADYMGEPGYRVKQLRRSVYQKLNCHINPVNSQKAGRMIFLNVR